MATEYVSSACRADQHGTCDDNPVVLCACPCHDGRRSQLWFRSPERDRVAV
ncbi:MAG: hypothetical protein KGJ77_01680 [Acidobacteriota bacterium]|nr:hypothetical protein [Acidobacteriota bacterium]